MSPIETKDPSVRDATGLVGVAIRQPVFTTMIMLGLVVLGIFSFGGLGIDEYPDVSIPVVTIETRYSGASTESVEREVTKKIEEAVNPTSGVDKITSISLEGVSAITVEFELGTDIDAATADVRSKIEQVRNELPADIDAPVVQQYDPAATPVVSLALASETMSVGALTTLADGDIRRALEGVNGVGRVQIAGGLEREVHVLLDPKAMEALKVTAKDVMGALQQQNLDIPAGRVEEANRERLVRVSGRITRPEQFEHVIVADRGAGVIRLGQIAQIRDTTEEARSVAMIDGKPAVGLDLLKVSGSNTVAVADEVQEAIVKLRSTLPEGVTLRVVRDNSVQIRESVNSVEHELILGALLTVAIVFLFLADGRATMITALSLPVSVISTFVLFAALDFTLNTMTMMALSLSIGVLIDDAIVVIENIVRRRQMGESAVVAAFKGTQEIFLAVMATTLTLVAVFVPVAFMGGIVGKFFFQFGLTIAWAVLVSLFVSFTLTPMLAASWAGSGEAHVAHGHGASSTSRNPLTRFIAVFNRWFDKLAEAFRALSRWSLRHRLTTLAIAAASFVGAILLLPMVGGAFLPDQDTSQFEVQFDTPTGSSIAYSESKARELSAALEALPGVAYTYTTVGAGVTGSVTSGVAYVKLVNRDQRELSQEVIMTKARTVLGAMYGIESSVLPTDRLGGAVKPIQVAIRGADVDELQAIADQVMAVTRKVPGAIEVESSLGDPKPEVRLDIDIDRANDLGLDVSRIASTVQPLLAGQTATTWEDSTGEEHDVVVRLPHDARTTAERIASLPIATRGTDGETVTVPLGQVASIAASVGPAQIDRRDLERVVTVYANVALGSNVGDITKGIQKSIESIKLPPGYTIGFGGDSEDMAETAGYVGESVMLAVILIYLILASQFGSFTQPFSIMFALPLSLVGVMLALMATGDTLNLMSMIGVLLLMGLVTKNAILLVDNANQQRREGKSMVDALVEAGVTRLRPIVMTTLAMIFGMIPIALGTGEGGELRAPMARAVIGGLLTSTLLTLIVVPVVCAYLHEATEWLKQRRVRSAAQVVAEGIAL